MKINLKKGWLNMQSNQLPGPIIFLGFLEIFYGVISPFFISVIWLFSLGLGSPDNHYDNANLLPLFLLLLFMLLLSLGQIIVGIVMLLKCKKRILYYYALILNVSRCIFFLPCIIVSGFGIYYLCYDNRVKDFYK